MRNFNMDFREGMEIPQRNWFLADTSQSETFQGQLSLSVIRNFFPVEDGTCLWKSGEVLDVYLGIRISGLHSQKTNGTKMRGTNVPRAVVSSCPCGASRSSEPGAPSWKELPHPPEQRGTSRGTQRGRRGPRDSKLGRINEPVSSQLIILSRCVKTLADFTYW